MKRNMFVLLIICNGLLLSAIPQNLVREDIKTFVQNIPSIPVDIVGLHQVFSITTTYGDKLNDAAIFNPVYDKIKAWVSSLHDASIREKIKEHRQNNMSFAVQFEDERLKLALRPLAGAAMLRNTAVTKCLGKMYVERLVALEKTFDWQQYYKVYDKIMKDGEARGADLRIKAFDLEEKIPMIQTEWGLQKDPVKLDAFTTHLAREKLKTDLETFRLHQQAWMDFFNKYKTAALQLHEVLEELHYGEKCSTAEQLVITILTDIQARSLEAIEKMVWQEMILVVQGELLWQAKKLVM